jgi:signal transduction histidine kinase
MSAASVQMMRSARAPEALTVDPADLLNQVRIALSRVVHDVNNPLAVISGNAQLLLELVRIMELDAELAKPISDIEEASRELAERLAQLSRLREDVRVVATTTDVVVDEKSVAKYMTRPPAR